MEEFEFEFDEAEVRRLIQEEIEFERQELLRERMSYFQNEEW